MVEEQKELNVEQTIQALTEKGYSVRTKEDEAAFIDREIKNSHSKLFTMFDIEIEGISGFKKDPHEKSTDYLKRAFAEKLKPLSDIQNKLKDYETKGIQSNELAQEYKKRVEFLENEKKTIEEKLSGELNVLKQQVFNAKKDTVINTAIANVKPLLRADINDQIKEDIVFAKVSKFNQDYKTREFEEMIVFTDKEGDIVRSKKDGKPMTADEIFISMFDQYIDKGRKLGGTGGGKGDASNASDWGSLAKEKGFKSLLDITDYLNTHFQKEGKNYLSKEYNEAFLKMKGALQL